MIVALRSNKASFRQIGFGPGLNVILADRTKEETKKQSRNGLGKSTFIELLHFCLGGDFKGPVTAPALKGWVFTLDLVLKGKAVAVSRDTAVPSRVVIEGDATDWPIQPKLNRESGQLELSYKDWALVLGSLMFGLPIKETGKYRPTFRTLISYFSRRGKDAYTKPFEFMRKQSAWSVQVLNSFLLGLETQDAIDFQKLKDRKDTLLQLKKLTTGAGTAKEFLGTLGDYEAQKVRLEGQVRKEEQELFNFKVHPQYEDMSRQANALTEEIHQFTNENVTEKRLVELYQQTLVEEKAPQSAEVAAVYERAGIELPGVVKKRLDEVQSFHAALIGNRKSFLTSEIQRLTKAIQWRSVQAEERTNIRAELMQVLRTHGALEEYTRLQEKHLKTRAELESVINRIKNIRDLQEGESSLKIDREILVQRARRGLDERSTVRDRAIELFNANSQALYEAPGNLVVDVDDNGFRFKVEIQRSSSGGVGNMKVFCYDLALAQLWSEKSNNPGLLIHDSIIFEGVDERQQARALELAATEASSFGFQYFVTVNSDAVPSAEFTPGFDLSSYVRLVLSDKDETSRLMGIRFEVDEKSSDSEAAESEEQLEA
jgi:uncharacterized protein YydD (DUF2326 family)